MTLEKFLKDLADEEKPLKHSGLLQLSGLTPEEVAGFEMAWPSLSQARKCEVLSKLAGLGEDNLELDFTAVFGASLRDDNDKVREKAVRGLIECEDRVMIRPLIELLKNDPSPQVKATAAISLGKFAEMAQEGKLLARDAERIREALLSAIDHEQEDGEVRRRAIEAVASFNSQEVEHIIRQAYHSSYLTLKQCAIYAMGRSSDTQWLPTVVDETHHEDPAIRYEAANAAGRLGDESTVPHLIRLIQDEDFQVQLSAVAALGAIGGSLAKRALLQCLKMGEDALEDAAQAALANLEFDEGPLGF